VPGIQLMNESACRVGVETIGEVCRRSSLRWFGHVKRKGDDYWVREVHIVGSGW
jgi:hypothetical protein